MNIFANLFISIDIAIMQFELSYFIFRLLAVIFQGKKIKL